MSTLTATMPMTVSKPKVHRPPFIGTHKNQQKQGFPGFLLFWAAVLLALIGVSLSINKEPTIKEATTLPAVAVVSQRLTPAAPKETTTDTNLLPTPIGEAQAETGALPSAGVNAKSGATILLQDKTSGIVGQMAKIPLENEQITEVKAINEVDNGGGHELLSIVGKY